jgi:hypothetical protein
MSDEKDPVMTKAIEEGGGPAEVSRFITENYPETPITAQAICDWKKVPPRRVLQLEAAVRAKGGKTTRHELDPGMYPLERKRVA